MELLIGLAIGVAFGYILRRSSLTGCGCIRDALALRDLHMLKLMITAIGVGAVLVWPLSALGLVHFSVKPLYLVGVALGGLLFGVGMAVAGYCPGTILAALPGGDRNVLWTLFGGLAGAFAYSLAYGSLKPLLVTPYNFGKVTLPSALGTHPVLTGVAVGAALLVLAQVLDKIERNAVRAGRPEGEAMTHGAD